MTQRRVRDGQLIGYSYDNLSRLVAKDVPNAVLWEFDATYAYDNLGRLTAAVDTNTHAVRFTYDALGRVLSEGADHYGAKSFQYDLAGRRTRLTFRDGLYVTYDYNAAGDMTAVRENGSVSLASFAYDDLGRRVSLTRGNGTVTSYGYDAASRLASLSFDLGGTAHDHNIGLAYNPAGQIVSRTASNDLYAWTGHANAGVTDTVNGLNQLTAAGGAAVSHDGRGNTTGAGAASYVYTSENRLASGGGALFAHDPLGRMHQLFASNTVLQYDGQALIVELAGLWPIAKRYVHGPGVDEVLVEYTGAGTSDKRWLHADERGSVVALSDAAGNVTAINKYDEYGQPHGALTGRFGYTGQAWMPEIGLSYYKARIYNPVLGRFMQTDPIGYAAGMNLYDYVSGDSVNMADSTGLKPNDVLTGTRIPYQDASRNCAACHTTYFGLGPVATRDVTDYSINGVYAGTLVGSWRAVGGGNGWSTSVGTAHQSGDPISAPQVKCRSCHGIETSSDDRYTTAEENEQLIEVVASLLPAAKVAKLLGVSGGIARWLGSGYRSGQTRDGNYWFQSADGQRRFRIDSNPPRQGRFGGPHAQFEVRNSRGNFGPAPGVPEHIWFRGK